MPAPRTWWSSARPRRRRSRAAAADTGSRTCLSTTSSAPLVVRDRGQPGDVRDAEQTDWSKSRPRQCRVVDASRRANRVHVGDLRRGPVQAPPLRDLGEQTERAAIASFGITRDHRLAHRPQQRVLGGQAAREGQRATATLPAPARHSCNAGPWSGFAVRAYSYPPGEHRPRPGRRWTSDRSALHTAPVRASGSCPA